MVARVLIVVVMALAARTFLAEQITFEECPPPDIYNPEDPFETLPYHWNCTINQVIVNPCPEATNNAQVNACKIKRGKNASIEIDFTPEVASDSLRGQAYWPTAAADMPLPGMIQKACQFTECPLKANHRQRYAINITIDKSFQPRSYDVKWRLFKEDVLDCCFIFPIKLVK